MTPYFFSAWDFNLCVDSASTKTIFINCGLVGELDQHEPNDVQPSEHSMHRLIKNDMPQKINDLSTK